MTTARSTCSSQAGGPHAWVSRPSSTRYKGLNGQQLPRSCLRDLCNLLHAAPLSSHDEQGLLVMSAEHARETPAIDVDGLKRVTTITHAHASPVGNVGIPHCI